MIMLITIMKIINRKIRRRSLALAAIVEDDVLFAPELRPLLPALLAQVPADSEPLLHD